MSERLTIDDVRESVREFAIAMEEKLRKNDDKGHWANLDFQYFYKRLHDEYIELGETEELPCDKCGQVVPHPDQQMDEAVDCGNFAMMIFDNNRKEIRGNIPRRLVSIGYICPVCKTIQDKQCAFTDGCFNCGTLSPPEEMIEVFGKECLKDE